MPDIKLLAYYEDNENADIKRYMKGEVVSVHDIDEDLGTEIDVPTSSGNNLMALIMVSNTTKAAQQYLLEEVRQESAEYSSLTRRRRYFIDYSLLPAAPTLLTGGTPVVDAGTGIDLAAAVVEN